METFFFFRVWTLKIFGNIGRTGGKWASADLCGRGGRERGPGADFCGRGGREKSVPGPLSPVEPLLALQGESGQARISVGVAVEREGQARISVGVAVERNLCLALSPL